MARTKFMVIDSSDSCESSDLEDTHGPLQLQVPSQQSVLAPRVPRPSVKSPARTSRPTPNTRSIGTSTMYGPISRVMDDRSNSVYNELEVSQWKKIYPFLRCESQTLGMTCAMCAVHRLDTPSHVRSTLWNSPGQGSNNWTKLALYKHAKTTQHITAEAYWRLKYPRSPEGNRAAFGVPSPNAPKQQQQQYQALHPVTAAPVTYNHHDTSLINALAAAATVAVRARPQNKQQQLVVVPVDRLPLQTNTNNGVVSTKHSTTCNTVGVSMNKHPSSLLSSQGPEKKTCIRSANNQQQQQQAQNLLRNIPTSVGTNDSVSYAPVVRT